MKKKWTILFILAVACAFSISAIAATSFEEQDFDGKFKMDVVKGADFDKTEAEGVVTYLDADSGLFVIYTEDPSINPNLDDKDRRGNSAILRHALRLKNVLKGEFTMIDFRKFVLLL